VGEAEEGSGAEAEAAGAKARGSSNLREDVEARGEATAEGDAGAEDVGVTKEDRKGVRKTNPRSTSSKPKSPPTV